MDQKVVKPRSRSLAFTLVETEPRGGKTKVVETSRAKMPEKEVLPEEKAPETEKVIPKPEPPTEKQRPTPTPALQKKTTPAPSKKIRLKQKKKTVVSPPKKPVKINSEPPQQKEKNIVSNETSAFAKGLTSEHKHVVQPKGGLAGKGNAAPSGPKVVMASPAYSENPDPVYPRVARKRGYEGVVLLKVLVGGDGRVEDLLVSKSSGYDVLDRSALKAVREWLFEPGNVDGKLVKMWVKVPVQFALKGR